MKPVFWIPFLVIALVLSLGAVWYFMRSPDADPATWDAEPPGAGTPGTAGSSNPRATKFAELDSDGDGKLSLIEFTGRRKPAEAEKWFKLRDGNNDGFVSHEEFLPFSARPRNQ